MPTRTPDADPDDQARAQRNPAAGESPAIPSLASLRDPRRRAAVDLLVPSAPAPPATPAAGPPTKPHPPDPSPPSRAARPPEWADLWLLGRHVARGIAAVPARALLWSVRRPVACVRRVTDG